MIRKRTVQPQTAFEPRFQWLPRWANTAIPSYELSWLDKVKRALLLIVGSIVRLVFRVVGALFGFALFAAMMFTVYSWTQTYEGAEAINWLPLLATIGGYLVFYATYLAFEYVSAATAGRAMNFMDADPDTERYVPTVATISHVEGSRGGFCRIVR